MDCLQTVSVSQKVDAGGYTLGADGVTLTPTATLQAGPSTEILSKAICSCNKALFAASRRIPNPEHGNVWRVYGSLRLPYASWRPAHPRQCEGVPRMQLHQ